MQENVIEIFSSIQGEGVYVGCRQAFVRLEGCNLACAYCDTEHAEACHPACRVQQSASVPTMITVLNPLTAEDVATYIADYVREVPHQALSLTGGEPLLHVAFIKALSTHLQLPFLLETNGTMSRALTQVLPCIDIVSMDVKLPSMVGRTLWEEHRTFLQVAREKDVYVKIVVPDGVSQDELEAAFRLVAAVDAKIPVILQPVTPVGRYVPPRPASMLAIQQQALQVLRDVRVIPQTHVMMQQL